jgi:hypothetical protein
VELEKLKPDKYGVLDVRRKPGCLSIAVSEAQVHHTLLILDALIREFEKRGATVIPVCDEKPSRLAVGSEEIEFYVREQSKQTIEKGSSWDQHVYSPKGKLSLFLGRYSGRAWHEGKVKRLEEVLGEIVVRIRDPARAESSRTRSGLASWPQDLVKISESLLMLLVVLLVMRAQIFSIFLNGMITERVEFVVAHHDRYGTQSSR